MNRGGRPRKSTVYKSETQQIIDLIWTAAKRVESVDKLLQQSQAAHREVMLAMHKEFEAVLKTATSELKTEISNLRNQVNKANRVIAKLLVERANPTDYDGLRQSNHAYGD